MIETKQEKYSETTLMMEKRFSRFGKLSWKYKKCFTMRGDKFGLSANEMALLLVMYNYPEKDSANKIKNELGITKGMISRYVDELIRKGYLRSEHDSKDRRIIRLYLCDKAVEICEQVNPDIFGFYEFVAQGIDSEKMAIMLETMEQISGNVEKIDALK